MNVHPIIYDKYLNDMISMIHDLHFSILDFFFQTSPGSIGIQRTESRRNATAPGAATAKPHMAAIPVPSNAPGIRPSDTLEVEIGQGRCPNFSAKIGWFNVNTMVRYGC